MAQERGHYEKITAAILSSIITISAALAATGFNPVRGAGFNPASAYTIITSDSYYRFNSTIPVYLSTTMKVSIASFGLGAVGFDYPSGHLKVVSVKGPSQVSVLLTGASGGATTDNLTFFVAAAAGTPKGVQTLEVSIENKLTGDNGTIKLFLDVR